MRIFLLRTIALLGIILSQSMWGNGLLETRDSTTICVYSKDRPLQLYAFLESLYKYVNGNFTVTLIYKASTPQFKEAYNECFKYFSEKNLTILAQDNQATNDFKPLTLSVLSNTSNKYILFAVDDIIIKDYINLAECVYYLKQTNSYSFHLRLGKNVTYSYTARQPSPVPLHNYIDSNNTIISWQFNSGTGEWCYPNSLDMCLYENTEELQNLIISLQFSSPNTFEAAWADSAWYTGVLSKQGLCYIDSKIVNIPLNVTQQDWTTSYNMGYSPAYLLELFNKGLKININSYYKLNHCAPHHEIKPVLIYRDAKPKKIKLADQFKTSFYEAMEHSRYFKAGQAQKDPNWCMLNDWFYRALHTEFSEEDPFIIPPLFHLIWLGSVVPERYHLLAKKLKEFHPYAQVVIWTDKDVNEFDFVNRKAFEYETNYGARSDVFRYEILNKYGGVYLDGDFEIYQPLHNLLRTCSFFAGLAYDQQLVLYNGLIAATPGNPIIQACLEIKLVDSKFDLDAIMHRTGPYHFTRCVLKEGPHAPGITAIFPVAFFYPWPNYELHNNQQEHIDSFKRPYSFTVHKWAASWHGAFKS